MLLPVIWLVQVPAARGAVADAVLWGAGWNSSTVVSNVTAMAVCQTMNPLAVKTDGTLAIWIRPELHPTGISNVVDIALGYDHGLALHGDGTVMGIGSPWYGDTIPPADLTNAVAVSAGYKCSLALRDNGTLVAWGYNWWGQTNVPPGLSNVVAIAAGYYHSLALKADGTVVAWGNYNDGTVINIPAGLSNVVSISAGDRFSLALKNDGTAQAWGQYDNQGQTAIPAGTSNVVAIAAGERHGLALKSDGTVMAWGSTNAYQTLVPAGLTNVFAIEAGGSWSVALTNDGAPAITWHPRNQQIYSGATQNLRVGAVGILPLSYQWQHNGVDIDGATNAWFTLTNFAVADVGNYTAVVANSLGAVTSAPARLDMVMCGPVITCQPSNRVTVTRDLPMLSVFAEGSQPLYYQWRFNGRALPGASQAILVITNVQGSDAGNYEVVITNAYGSVVSSNVVLTFIPFQLSPLPEMTQYGCLITMSGFPADATWFSVYGSTNLIDWENLYTDGFWLPLGSTYHFYDYYGRSLPRRFYRVEAY